MEKKPNILIIDDEAQILDLFQRWLTAFGYPVTTATNGQEALDLLTTHSFPLIFCDCKMPGVKTATILGQAKSQVPPPYFILISGFGADDEEVIELLQAGVDLHVEKPIRFTSLQPLLTKILGK